MDNKHEILTMAHKYKWRKQDTIYIFLTLKYIKRYKNMWCDICENECKWALYVMLGESYGNNVSDGEIQHYFPKVKMYVLFDLAVLPPIIT